MDVHAQFSAYKCVRFCGLMMSASSTLLSSHKETDDDRKTQQEETQLHLAAGIAAVQQLLPMLEAFAETTMTQNPVRGPPGFASLPADIQTLILDKCAKNHEEAHYVADTPQVCRAFEAHNFLHAQRVTRLPQRTGWLETLALLPYSRGLTTLILDLRFLRSAPPSLTALVTLAPTQLRHLHLLVRNLNGVEAATLAAVTQLTKLELFFEDTGPVEHPPHIPLMPQLRSFSLVNYTNTDLVPTGMDALTAMTQLTFLEISSLPSWIDLPVATTLAHMAHLRSLHLGDWYTSMYPGESAWQELGNSLPTMTHLTNLDLYDISLDNSDFDPSHFNALAPGLTLATSLLELRLASYGYEDISVVFDTVGKALLESVAALTRLQTLCICHIPLKQYDCHKCLKSLTALASLHLMLPMMAPDASDDGGAVASMLQGMPRLTSLSLSTEGMGPLCITSLFVDTLPSMSQLESLTFKDCDDIAMCSALAVKVREHCMPRLTVCDTALSGEQCAMLNIIACQDLFKALYA